MRKRRAIDLAPGENRADRSFILRSACSITVNASPDTAHQTTELYMSRLQLAAAVVSVVLGLSSTCAQAGPCTASIAQFETAIRESAGNPMAGLTARQSVAAQLDRQPTAASMKQEEERLKAEFAATMARAKRLDAKGDRNGCNRALKAAKRMYIL